MGLSELDRLECAVEHIEVLARNATRYGASCSPKAMADAVRRVREALNAARRQLNQCASDCS